MSTGARWLSGWLLLGSLLLGGWLWPGFALAQISGAQLRLERTVTIQTNGRILVDGQRSTQAVIETLPDKYVFRYKAIDKPKQSLQELVITVKLPAGARASQVKASVIAVHGALADQPIVLDQSTIEFRATAISPEASVTLVVDLPKTAITFTSWQRVLAIIELLPAQYWLSVAITIPAIMLLFAGSLLMARIKDLFLRPSQPLLTAPPSNLSPALVGTLLHGYVGMREIAATLIDLAHRGYIDIIYRGENDFAFSQKKNWQQDPHLYPFERHFLNQLFSQTVISDRSTINQRLNRSIWSESVSQGIDDIYQQMNRLGYFESNPQQAHALVRFVGMIIFFLSVIGLAISLLFVNRQPLVVVPWLVTIMASPAMIRLSFLVPRRTEAGRQQARAWLSYRRFMTNSGRAGSAEEIQLYERYLAYAIALKAEAEWTARFQHLPCRVPDWFFSQTVLIDTYVQFATLLFSIISFIGTRFSFSRKPST